MTPSINLKVLILDPEEDGSKESEGENCEEANQGTNRTIACGYGRIIEFFDTIVSLLFLLLSKRLRNLRSVQ